MSHRLRFLLLLPLLLFVPQVGCGPAVSREELGTIVSEVPAFDPYDQKFPLPKLGPEPEEKPANDAETKPTEDGNSRGE